METPSQSVLNAKLLLVILAFLVPTLVTSSIGPNRHHLVAKLIHYDSIQSPFYNASATITDRATRALERSIARLSFLRATTVVKTPEDIRGALFAGRGCFLVNIFIGERLVPQLVLMDTASHLLWVHCLPCVGCHSTSPIFDPSQSSTYYPFPCDHNSYCRAHCDEPKNECTYSIIYEDGTSSSGNVATEQLTFFTTEAGSTTVSNIVFGCGRVIQEPDPLLSGIMGLGYATTSLANQLANKFSYCIGNIHDPYYSHNRLILGNGAIIRGDSTPLEVYGNAYYLTLEGISVGDYQLPIDPRVFRRSQHGHGGVIIDSGTEWTYLVRDAYEALKGEVARMYDAELTRAYLPDRPELLCYYGDMNRDLVFFPVITFHFAGEAEFKLDRQNVVQPIIQGGFCLSIDVANDNVGQDASVIGVIAQQYHNIAYDLSTMTLSFDMIDCQDLI
ncbi:hypothetical protein RJ639_033180 [Escallonia herrerae]|uniref:Peptidase A1 domain-containing protein n=1 Tax=Escallonia herrerae TaxID=1293975 RepID=A0AA88WWS8_9ASTE|nr:hypothetical protein RJ639_033180 [Escallonia herrerae]